jgi:SPP1 family predicted phage head-tail adaptor
MIYANNLNAVIAIGAMDEKLTLKVTTSQTYNSLGEITGETTTDTILACHVIDEIEQETDVMDKQTVMDYRDFITRYKACAVTDKVLYDGATYDIIRVETMGRKRYMKLRCKLVD